MTEFHMMWMKQAADITAYRRMYCLAVEIIGSGAASKDVRHAARRVVRVLEGVVDQPIADGRVLARGRQRFMELVAVLENAPSASGVKLPLNRENRPASTR